MEVAMIKMTKIKVPCLPLVKIRGLPGLTEDELQSLHKEIVAASVAIPELGIRDENDLFVFFPADLMTQRPNPIILIEVGDIDPGARCVRPNARLAEEIEKVLAARFPKARIAALFNADVP